MTSSQMMWGRRTGVNKSSSCAYLTSPGMQCTHSSKVKTTFPWPYRGVQLPIKPLGPQLWWVPTEMTVNPHHKWAVRATWQGKILLPPKSQSPWGGSMLWGLEGLKPEMGPGQVWGNSLQGTTEEQVGSMVNISLPQQSRCHSFWDQNPE